MARFSIKPAEIGETVSLVTSIAIILFVIGYLIFASLQPQTEQLAVSSRIGAVVEAGIGSGQHVVPVDIINHGARGIAALNLDITVAQQHHMIELQYLAAGADRRIYIYSPGAQQPEVTITPLSYHID